MTLPSRKLLLCTVCLMALVQPARALGVLMDRAARPSVLSAHAPHVVAKPALPTFFFQLMARDGDLAADLAQPPVLAQLAQVGGANWQCERQRKGELARRLAIEARVEREQEERRTLIEAQREEEQRLEIERRRIAEALAAEERRRAEAEERRIAEAARQEKERQEREAQAQDAERRRLAEVQAAEARRREEAEAKRRADEERRVADAARQEKERLERETQAQEAERRRLADLQSAEAKKREEAEAKKRAEDEKRLAEAARIEREKAEREAQRLAAETKKREEAEAKKRAEDEKRLAEVARLEREKAEREAQKIALAPVPQTPAIPSAQPQPGSGGVSPLIADEMSSFTAEQRRLARERIARENRGRSDIIESEMQQLGPATVPAETGPLASLPTNPADPFFRPDAPIAPVIPPETIKAAQEQLKRLGCYNGAVSGTMSPDTAVGLETAERNLGDARRSLNPVSDEVVAFLKDRQDKLCQGKIGCGPGQAKQGTTCIAALPKPVTPRRQVDDDDEDDVPARPSRPRAPAPQRQAQPAPRAPAAAPAAPRPAAPAASPRPSVNLTM